MFERIKSMFSAGIAGKYEMGPPVMHTSLWEISAGRDRKSLRPVLVKIYTEEGMDVEAKLDGNYRERPLAEILPELVNRFVVRTIESGRVKGRLAEVIEATGTATLHDAMAHGRLTAKAFKRAMLQVGEALMYLHSHGIVHRGLSPDAITVTEEGDAKILDLSLVMDMTKTHAGGTVVGPVGYVAPEVIRRGAVDQRSDIYSMGIICYEMFAGMRPFPNYQGYERLLKVINAKPMPLVEKNPEVSAELNAVVMKALSKTPEGRWQSVEEMLGKFAAARLPEGITTGIPAYAAA